MATGKCPMCESPCIIKLIATSDKRWHEVDVCKMCGTMYPRDKGAALKAPPKGKKTATKGKKPAKKPARKGKKKAAR
jgi:hypothetical protein